MMKNITIQFMGLGFNDLFQAHIYLYDENHSLLLEDKTYDRKIQLCLDPFKGYQMIAISGNEVLRIRFYVDCNREKYTFFFPRSLYERQETIVTFHLTDFYYPNLPIEKGEIILG